MPNTGLRPEQQRAVFTAGNVVVRAGAGSGKTEVLARRFVALLAGDIPGGEPIAAERMAAITFTEKAACDMQERIAAILAARIAGETPGPARGPLALAQRRLPLARISTIHAFCARILRENPLEAGLEPAFRVLDEYESAAFAQSAAREILVAAIHAGDPGARFLVAARRVDGRSRYREGALQIVTRLIQTLQRSAGAPEMLARTRETVSATAARRERANQLARNAAALIEELIAIKNLRGASGEMLDAFRDRWPAWRAALLNFNADSDPCALDTLRDLAAALPAKRSPALKPLLAKIGALIDKSGAFGLGGKLVGAYGEQRAAGQMLAVARFVDRAAQELEKRRRFERVVTFDDLLSFTLRLLRSNSAVLSRLRASIRALLVDEYQDTDPVQDAVVRELTRPDAPGAAPQYFLVGDEKQSIYRFRGADVTVFRAPRNPVPAELRLSENRRALPNILEFVNYVSAGVMRPPDGLACGSWIEFRTEDRLTALRQAPDHDVPQVEIVVAPPADGSAISQRRRAEADALAARIAELLGSGAPVIDRGTGAARPARASDIVILMRSLSDVDIYQRALGRAEIAFYTVKGRGFFQSAEVIDLVNLLSAVAEPSDSIALAAALRSPLFAISDETLLEVALYLNANRRESFAGLFAPGGGGDFAWLTQGRAEAEAAWRVLDKLREMRDRAPAAEILERALDLTNFEAVMLGGRGGRRRAANLDKLVEVTRRFEAGGLFSFADLIAHLRRLIDEEPLEPEAQTMGERDEVVRLMTIHQAKGLEFPIVCLADMGRVPPNNTERHVISPKRGLICCDTYGSGHDEIPNPLIEEYRLEEKAHEEAESARLLYVALTRARDRLILGDPLYDRHWSAQIRALLNGRIEEFTAAKEEQRNLTHQGVRLHLRVPACHPAAPPAGAAPVPARAARADFEALAARRLDISAPAETELTASPTALADFERCPRQYQFRHLLGLPEGDSFALPSAGGHAVELGRVAHSVLQQLNWQTAERGSPEPEVRQLVERFAASAPLSAAERERLTRDITSYAAARDPAERIIGREIPFFLRLDDRQTTLFIRGRIDVLAELGEILTVRDYKYAAGDDEAAVYSVQMECYALAAAEAYPERPVHAELQFLRGHPRTLALPLPAAEESRARLIGIARGMLAALAPGDYPRRPASAAQCRALGCGYVGRCWHASGPRREKG